MYKRTRKYNIAMVAIFACSAVASLFIIHGVYQLLGALVNYVTSTL